MKLIFTIQIEKMRQIDLFKMLINFTAIVTYLQSFRHTVLDKPTWGLLPIKRTEVHSD
jgi:hypothetical protein